MTINCHFRDEGAAVTERQVDGAATILKHE
jgi:hypothetical protein